MACQQFLQLMWKNCLLRKRHFIVTAFEVVLPLLFLIILVSLIYSTGLPNHGGSEVVRNETIYPAENPLLHCKQIFSDWYKVEFAYSPKTSFAKELIDRTIAKCGVNKSDFNAIAFDNEEDMLLYFAKVTAIDLHKKSHEPFGIVFTNMGRDDTKLPDSLHYKLRLSSGLDTSYLYAPIASPGPRKYEMYNFTAFWSWQTAIDQAFIDMVQKSKNLPPKDIQVKMKRFPFPPYSFSYDFFGIIDILPHLIVFGFVVLYPVVVKRIVDEKANRAKEMMKMMGMSDWVYWGSTFTANFLLTIVLSALITLLLTINKTVIYFTDGSIIFVTMLLYSASSLLSCMLISTFFNRPVFAVIVTVVFWTVHHSMLFAFSFLPIHVSNLMIMPKSVKVAMCLLPNGALQMAIRLISMMEEIKAGVNWSNLNGETPLNVNMALVWGSQILSCIICCILIWYVSAAWPWQYGIPKPFYFPFTRSYWLGHQPKSSDYHELENHPRAEYFEDGIVGETPGIVISHVTKVYKSKIKTTLAVSDASLNCYNGQITALLGHNGAGKTTVMNIVTGLFPPSNGTVSINGHDIVKDTKLARQSLGLCPQHNVLYDTLTVEEHLKFFAGLKGVPRSQIDNEVSYILNHLKLDDHKGKMTKQLSGGVKRKLCLGIAVIGGSEVLILDEPTSGMDPEARRTSWNLLQHLRNSRTIFLTTHYMEEADVLGNRIAIMFNGTVHCCGSPLFLKRKFGSGYHLRIIKEEYCDVPKITNIVQRHLPEAMMESDIHKELTYSLISSDSSKFGLMFEELELLKKALGIETFGVTVTTMEDVFLKIGNMPQHDVNGQDDIVNSTINDASKIDHNEILLEQSSVHHVRGLHLHLQQIKGLFLKRFHYTKRHWIIIIPQVIIPCLILYFLLWVDNVYIRNLVQLRNPPLHLDLKQMFGNSIGFYNFTNGKESSLFANEYFKNELRKSGVSVTEESDPDNFLLNVAKQSFLTYITQYFVGGTVEELHNGTLSVEAWYNGEPLHVGAISLNLMHSAILKYVTGNQQASIDITNSPLLLLKHMFFPYELRIMSFVSSFLCAIFIPLVVCFMAGSFVLYPIHERTSKCKLLQKMSGVHGITLWLTSFIWDFIIHFICCVFLLIPFAIYDKEDYYVGESGFLGSIFFLFVMFGWCCIPFSYLLSFYWKKVSTAFALLTIITLLTGVVPALVLVPVSTGIPEPLRNNFTSLIVSASLLQLFPSFSITWGMALAAWTARLNKECDAIPSLYLEHICPTIDSDNDIMKCCKDHCTDNCFIKEKLLHSKAFGAGQVLIHMFIYGIFYFVLLCLLETRYTKRFLYKIKLAMQQCWQHMRPKKSAASLCLEAEDADVLAEERRVKEVETKGGTKDEAMIVLQLSRTFGFCNPFYAVNKLTFAVHKEECFGLLGVNGAGKTTTFCMLVGDMCYNEGSAIIGQYNIQDNLNKFQSYIGYCPQYDAVLDRLTGEEMLYLFARLRGIPEDKVATTVHQLIRAVDLQKHADKQTQTYSCGNKRKLSLAIALIGTPPLVFLDEPTSGVDPVARRKIWSTLMWVKEITGCSIVLTSHSMEECEALCNRVAIMVNGRFQCLGTTDHLRSKFGQGYTIIAKMTEVQGQEVDNTNDIKRLQEFIENSFNGSVLKDIYQGTVHYHVTDSSVLWSHMFTKMEEAKEIFQLEDYMISGTTLEQIFLSFARKQRPTKEFGCNGVVA